MSGKATFIKADLFETDFSKATVITMFLLPSINMQLRPKILDMKPGTRIVSNTFTWRTGKRTRLKRLPSARIVVHGASLDRSGEGRRHVDASAGDVDLKQKFQNFAARWAARRSPTAS